MAPSCPRKIIHIDMDAFFAAVEQRENPNLKGKPVVVGGDPFGRGVVSTASYEARIFGIRSAMSAAQARKLCPQAVFVKPHFDLYASISEQVMSILRQHTRLVEPVSLDEAYLDVTVNRFGLEDPAVVARLIKDGIRAQTKLTASAGVATNCFIAKVASDMHKPDGLTVVRPGEERTFVSKMSVRKIPGVGPVTEKLLAGMGIILCEDILSKNARELEQGLGKWGQTLWERALGRDNRDVEPYHEPKQISVEQTFERDMTRLTWLNEKLGELSRELWHAMTAEGKTASTLILKVKYLDFEQVTRQTALPEIPRSWKDIWEPAQTLLSQKTLAGKKAIRLLGLGMTKLKTAKDQPSRIPTDLFKQ